MARTSKIVVPRNSEAAIQEFLNNNLAPELSREKVALLLNSVEPLRDIRGLTPEDKTKFVEKIDQVCRDNSFPPFETSPHYFCEDISDHRPKKCEIRSRSGGRV